MLFLGPGNRSTKIEATTIEAKTKETLENEAQPITKLKIMKLNQ